MKYLIDSNIIIYYLNGNRLIFDFFENIKEKSAISLISYYEVLNFDFSVEERKIVKVFLESFQILNISKDIIDISLENRNLKKIKMADNFILSTAVFYNLAIVTRNIKDFDKFYVNIVNPFDEN